MSSVQVGGRHVGDNHPCFIVAEIGINHNGDIDLAKRLISVAIAAGDATRVGLRKRTPELCVPTSQRSIMRETPWGYITYMDYRHKVGSRLPEYREIDAFCREHKIIWFASCWDQPSVNSSKDSMPRATKSPPHP